jgi:hypothetical protein
MESEMVIDRIMAVADETVGSRPGTAVRLTRKQRGEMAEAAFLAKAAGLGFRVSKPWGESSRYDLIVDNGRKLLRVQVKSAHRAGVWRLHVSCARKYKSGVPSGRDRFASRVRGASGGVVFVSGGGISKIQTHEAVPLQQEEEIEV